MKSVLEDIFYGRRGNGDNIKAGAKYWEMNKEFSKIYDELEKGLNKEQKKLLDDLFDQSSGLESDMSCANFKEGFKLGLLIAVETFCQ